MRRTLPGVEAPAVVAAFAGQVVEHDGFHGSSCGHITESIIGAEGQRRRKMMTLCTAPVALDVI